MKLLLVFLFMHTAVSVIPCSEDAECEALLRTGSVCNQNKVCTNPFANGGCLYNRLENWTKVRVCNSQDPSDAAEKGYCRLSPLGYAEVRIGIQNWESAIFVTYLLQILLSELLDVPSSIETSFFERQANLYQEDTRLRPGWSNDERALNRSSFHGDCVPFTTKLEGYLSCSHIIPEVGGSFNWAPPFVKAGIFEPTYPMGELGREGWHIPLFTTKHDPSLLHWSGLSGEENREKLAKTFKRPVSYLEYCEEVSPNNCSTPDEYAQRYPFFSDGWYENETWRYFVPDIYTGYFRYTEENNCTANPECTGHIVDYPCGWSSYTEAQAYHLNIALKSNGPSGSARGYWEEQLQDIWRAANATRNHVIMHYIRPDVMVSEFRNTDFSFERVTLPETTQECIDARRPDKLRCAENRTLRLGEPEGVCDEPPEALQKILSTGLLRITKGGHINEILHSPAYDALRAFTISDLRIDEIFKAYTNWPNPETKREFGLRDAVCHWAANHIDVIAQFVPPSYPRDKYTNRGSMSDPLSITDWVFAILAFASTLGISAAIIVRREERAIRESKTEFLFLILFGLLLVSVGSLTSALPTRDSLCVASIWFTYVGYSLELVPLVVKLAALNHVIQAGRRFRRVAVRSLTLYQASILVGFLVVIVLTVWTVTDPPREESFYVLSDAGAQSRDTMTDAPDMGGVFIPSDPDGTAKSRAAVVESFHCSSEKWDYWWAIFVSWQAFLLLVAAVLAFQNIQFRRDLVETRALAMMINVHLVFLGLRVVTFVSQTSDGVTEPLKVQQFRSLVNSVDVIATLAVYFVPKICGQFSPSRATFEVSGMYTSNSRPVFPNSSPFGLTPNNEPSRPHQRGLDTAANAAPGRDSAMSVLEESPSLDETSTENCTHCSSSPLPIFSIENDDSTAPEKAYPEQQAREQEQSQHHKAAE